MSTVELPCLWRDAGQAGYDALAAMTAHLPPGVTITAMVLGEDSRIMDTDGAVWMLEGGGVTRGIFVSATTVELTVWRAGVEVTRVAMPNSGPR